MARSLSRLQVIFLFALAVHVSTVRSAPRVAVEDEKRVGVKTSREVDKYVKLYASDTGPAPEFVCLITVVSVSDCEEYFEEVSAFVKTARGIITKAPAVQEGPMSLLVPYGDGERYGGTDDDTPLQRLDVLEKAWKDLHEFTLKKVYSAEEPLRFTQVVPIIRQIGSIFHRALFNWHYQWASTDMYDKLAPDEIAYVHTFFELYGIEHFNFHFGYYYGNRMSSFTYSHRRKGPLPINSGRFACGTTSQESPFWAAAKPIVDRLGIELHPEFTENEYDFTFYGIGWDHAKKYLKVYIMYHDIESLPDEYKEMTMEKMRLARITEDPKELRLAEHGLISFTYTVDYDHAGQESSDHSCTVADDGTATCNSRPKVALQETKVYVYPDDVELEYHAVRGIKALEIPDGVVGAAWMFATKRDFVPQYDIQVSPDMLALWKNRVGDEGTEIMERYEGISLFLETMNYFAKDKFVLYFPAGSG
jgi:hypothetical protein|eukprot:g6337.t1